MRIVLAGTRSFGSAVLEAAMLARHDVAGVISPEGDRLWSMAHRLGLPVSAEANAEWVQSLKADVIVASHMHAYLGRRTRNATPLGAFGYHPSLLPRHRGKDAVEWTIRMGDPIAGGTCYWFDSGVDTGPIAAADWCHVDPSWDASDLWREQLFGMGIRLTLKVLSDLDRRVVVSVPQDERFATWEPSLDTKPLHRPELLEIGPGPSGFRVTGDREVLRVGPGVKTG